MSPERELKYVSWTWIVSILVSLLLLIGGYLLNDTRNQICNLQDKKLDRSIYERESDRQQKAFDAIMTKMDRVENLLMRHMGEKGK
jgi:hypothetical protein